MINYFDIILEAFEENEIQVMNYQSYRNLSEDEINMKIIKQYASWFLSKMQIVERDYFVYHLNFLNECKNFLIIVRAFHNQQNSKDVIYYEYMNIAIQELLEGLEELDIPQQPTLTTIYGTDTEKLTELHDKFVEENLINRDLDSWLYWFGGISCNNPQQIQWLKKRTDAMYFIYKLCPDLQKPDRKFPLINNVFAPMQGGKFDSNDKPPINGNKVTDLIDTLF